MKLFNVSQLAASHVALDRIKDEIAKCDVLCQNCHTEHHLMFPVHRGIRGGTIPSNKREVRK